MGSLCWIETLVKEPLHGQQVNDTLIQIEVNGAKFCKKAAEFMASNPKAEWLLNDLANMEDGHKLLFQNMNEQFVEENEGKDFFDPNNEAATYLASFVEGKVFDM